MCPKPATKMKRDTPLPTRHSTNFNTFISARIFHARSYTSSGLSTRFITFITSLNVESTHPDENKAGHPAGFQHSHRPEIAPSPAPDRQDLLTRPRNNFLPVSTKSGRQPSNPICGRPWRISFITRIVSFPFPANRLPSPLTAGPLRPNPEKQEWKFVHRTQFRKPRHIVYSHLWSTPWSASS